MRKIKQHIDDNIKKVPRIFLRRLIEEKIAGQDLEVEDLIDALTDHILLRSGDVFHWDDGTDGVTKNLNISFTKQDIEKLEDDVKKFLNTALPELILKTVHSGADLMIKRIEKTWPEQKLHDRSELNYFRDRLDLRWAPALDPLRMMLIASREIGQRFADRLARSKAKKGLTKRDAIAILHMRACQTTLEILTLMENGLPDGAYARWRTLYEVSVVAFVIERFGDEIAERYLAHDAISTRESIVNEFRFAGKAYNPETLRGELKEVEEAFQEAIGKYGATFKSPYGWAAHNLGVKTPRFQDLEEAVDWNALPPDYKLSSYKVHAGIAGAVWSLGTVDGQRIIFAGATNAGLQTPAINTAFSLLHVTSLVFGKNSELETQMEMRSMVLLRDRVVRESRKAAKKLYEDEIEFRTG